MTTESTLERLRFALAAERARATDDAREATDALLAEAQRNEKQPAREAGLAHAEMLGRLSHDLRTPMTAILGFAGILEQTLRRRSERDAVETIRRNSERLLALIDDTLDMARLDTGQAALEIAAVELDGLLQTTVDKARELAPDGELTLELRVRDADLPVVRTDAGRVCQVVTHLISNAVEATDGGRIVVEVGTMSRPCGEPVMRIAVHDTGHGLSPDQLEGLFDPTRPAATTGKPRTSGLGLALSQRVVHALGGRIFVDSQLHAGSTFTVLLPLDHDDPISVDERLDSALPAPAVRRSSIEIVRDRSSSHPPRSVAARPPRTPAAARRSAALRATASERVSGRQSAVHAPTGPVRVLVVEDADDIRRVVELLLGTTGAEVTGASDGIQALDLISTAHRQASPYNIVLLDLGIPLLDGFGVIKRVRDEGIGTPVVAVTGRTGAAIRRACREAGFDDYMEKPIHPMRLIETVFRHGASSPA